MGTEPFPMNDAPAESAPRTPLRTILAYVIGGGASAFAGNGVGYFLMLYYTQALGLGVKDAGLAFSITSAVATVIVPVVGHITDHTRSRYGRRHPYLLLGGLAMAGLFYFFWAVPPGLNQPTPLFWYLLALSLIFAAAGAVFTIPYAALGFEICASYEERSRLQSIKCFFDQVFNLLGGALAWSLFFHDRLGSDGTRIDGTRIVENYVHMGIALTLTTLFLVLFCVYSTRRYANDNRGEPASRSNLGTILTDFCNAISDRSTLYVFGFSNVAMLGAVLVAQMQMFTYVDFMKFTSVEKTIVHGTTMVACALGSLAHAPLVVRYDKKLAGYFGMATAILGNAMLLIFFTGGVLAPETSWVAPAELPLIGGSIVPASVIAFALFQGLWWGGIGMLTPLIGSMVADVSEISYRKTGVLKDGSYSAVFSCVSAVALGVGVFINGWIMEWVGFVSGPTTRSVDAARNIAILTFVSGPIMVLLALPLLWKCPLDRILIAEHQRPNLRLSPNLPMDTVQEDSGVI